MRWPWRHREDVAPEGVRLVLNDGTVIRCGVLRDPDADHDGLTAWAAVPMEPVTAKGVLLNGGYLQVDVLPARTVLDFRMTAGDRDG
jgi:hypothetical protein